VVIRGFAGNMKKTQAPKPESGDDLATAH